MDERLGESRRVLGDETAPEKERKKVARTIAPATTTYAARARSSTKYVNTPSSGTSMRNS